MFLETKYWTMLWVSSQETFYMVSVSTLVTALAGIPLGILLVISRPGHILANPVVYRTQAFLVNVTRSIPFPIFIIFIMPLTRLIVGSSIGTKATIVPLALAAIVFMARLAETAILEVPRGVIEAAQAAGASTRQIIWRVLLPEARPGLLMGATITVITLISYSAMAGLIGGGGLGDLAVRYGYQRYQTDLMVVTVVLLILIVQAVQMVGDWLVRRATRR
ncbi:MAG: ABC transporter permease [Candidatus Adiutrix sp.]|jgi:D-methionine transport system permease protein|nr:ABC transporter permease [Candidatus Adiutrix sp.]